MTHTARYTAIATLAVILTLSATTNMQAMRFPTGDAADVVDRRTTDKVNVNTATVEQLALLPGVGPSLAEEIYTYAEAGPHIYDSKAAVNSACDHKCHIPDLKALDAVKGIGPAKLQLLTPYVTFTGATTLTVKVKSPTRKRSVK